MSDRLSLSQVAALMAYPATTAGGQLLFKTPALRGGLAMVRSPSGSPAFCSTGTFSCARSLRQADRSVGLTLGCLVFAEPLRYGS